MYHVGRCMSTLLHIESTPFMHVFNTIHHALTSPMCVAGKHYSLALVGAPHHISMHVSCLITSSIIIVVTRSIMYSRMSMVLKHVSTFIIPCLLEQVPPEVSQMQGLINLYCSCLHAVCMKYICVVNEYVLHR